MMTEEREEIMRLKWIESERRGYDIGLSRAVAIWMINHKAVWMEEWKKKNLAGRENRE